MAHLADYNTKSQYHAKVLKTKRLTPDDLEEVREIQLEVQEPEFKCEVDESFGVLVETNGEFGTNLHHRLYSVADLPAKKSNKTKLTFLVKRCNYVDEFNGELYPGISSNYLCDRQPGDEITITGPFHLPFSIPSNPNANLILIGMGTGIAPFRAFIKHIYKYNKDWIGKIRLFYGAKSGLELLYFNDKDDDLTNYYDKETFEAIHALSPRPHWNDDITIEEKIVDKAEEILEMLASTNTYIYVAGHEVINENLNKAFAKILGSEEEWQNRKNELMAGKRWAEIIY